MSGVEGWIDHDGGPNPVPGAEVYVRQNSGDGIWESKTYSAHWDWSAVIAYRVVTPAPDPQTEAMREALERIADPRNIHFAGDAQVVARDALSAIEGGGGALQPSASVATEPVADRWADLERLAKAATPGPWQNTPGEWEIYGNDGDNKVAHAFLRADQAFSAAANPAAILELIAAARRDEEAGQ